MQTRKILQFLCLTSAAGATAPSISWNGLPTKDVTGMIESCKMPDALWGIIPNPNLHTQKICEIHGNTYYMKAANEDSLKEMFGRKFARDNLKIRAPNSELLYEAGGIAYTAFGIPTSADFYLASKKIPGFETAYSKSPSLKHLFHWSPLKNYLGLLRAHITKNIGERGIAQLAVAKTFYGDLHGRNWGYDKRGLVLIDVDTMPTDLSGFFDLALTMTSMFREGLPCELSLNNIKEMRRIYLPMLERKIPKMPTGEEMMTPELYVSVVSAYIEACENAIQNALKIPVSNHTEPSSEMNALLYASFKLVSEKYENNAAPIPHHPSA